MVVACLPRQKQQLMRGERRQAVLMRWCVSMVWVVVLPFIIVSAQAQQFHQYGDVESMCHPSHSKNTTTYEWEAWNYYEILGLDRHAPSVEAGDDTVQSQQQHLQRVRKAYRKQAQQWHPDKQHQSSSDDKTALLQQQESYARFARISEAYEVLKSPDKRTEYDLFLQYCDDHTTTATTARSDNSRDNLRRQSRAGSSSVNKKRKEKWTQFLPLQNVVADPLRVFEEFLFGADESATTSSSFPLTGSTMDQDSQHHHNYLRRNKQTATPVGGTPSRMTKHEDVWKDPVTGEEIVRISQTEEYAVVENEQRRYAATGGETDQVYVRIVSQEFTRKFDLYTGRFLLAPLTEPYLRQEGYRSIHDIHSNETSRKKQKFFQKTKGHQYQSASIRPSLLFPGDMLTPQSALLTSPNKRYYAGLSKDTCELLVMRNNPFRDDVVHWSSGQDVLLAPPPLAAQQSCFATLKGPHLVVAQGKPERPNRILWYSEAEDPDDDAPSRGRYGQYGNSMSSKSSYYLAQLDNDGSLVVYKVWNIAPPNEFDHSQLSLMAQKALSTTRLWWKNRIRAVDYEALVAPEGNVLVYKQCLFATGPLGCHRMARRLYQLSLGVYYQAKTFMARIDQAFDNWMDLVSDEDDYLQALKESIWSSGNSFALESQRLLRKMLELLMLRNGSE